MSYDKNKIIVSLIILIIFSTLFIILNTIHNIRINNTNDFIKCISINDINNIKLCKNTSIPFIEIILQYISMLFTIFSLFYILIKLGIKK